MPAADGIVKKTEVITCQPEKQRALRVRLNLLLYILYICIYYHVHLGFL